MDSQTRKIFIMRHADPKNPEQILYGNLPGFPLSDRGKQQARETGEFLSGIPLHAIYASPRERTQQTARAVVELNSGRPEVISDERLRDIGLGSMQGKIPVPEWKRNRRQYLSRQEAEQGFERPAEIRDRMVEVFSEAIERHFDGNILFVSHGDPIDYLLQWVEQKPLSGLARYDVGLANIFEIGLDEHKVVKIFEPTI